MLAARPVQLGLEQPTGQGVEALRIILGVCVFFFCACHAFDRFAECGAGDGVLSDEHSSTGPSTANFRPLLHARCVGTAYNRRS